MLIKNDGTEYFITVTAQRFHVNIKKRQVIQWFWEVVFWLVLLFLALIVVVMLTYPRGLDETLTFSSLNLEVPLRLGLFMTGTLLLLSLLAKLFYHDEEIEVTPRGVEVVHHFFKIKPFRRFKEETLTELEVITSPGTCTVIAKNDQQRMIAAFPDSYSLHLSSMIRRCWHPA